MKKFQRLPLEQRKEEIQNAALTLFGEKGFSATTMENIVSAVSLSKGGVYRIYPSTEEILKDLMLQGMHLRNAYYGRRIEAHLAEGKALSLHFLVEIIGDSLLLYQEVSRVYVEFLIEKRRNPALQKLYEEICRQSEEDTLNLIRAWGAEAFLPGSPGMLQQLTELMNSAVLALHVLNLEEQLKENREALIDMITNILTKDV